jgi:hypothetical protein
MPARSDAGFQFSCDDSRTPNNDAPMLRPLLLFYAGPDIIKTSAEKLRFSKDHVVGVSSEDIQAVFR